MIDEHDNRFVSERLRADMAAALRVLEAADRALVTRDAALANVVLGFEADVRAGIGSLPSAVRADAAVESVIELAMRVADLARVAWRIDRLPPGDDELAHLRGDMRAVSERARSAALGDHGDVSELIRLVARADAGAATMLRECEMRRFTCLAS
jgi:hypothetical protein